MSAKSRVSASVDTTLLKAAERAVARGGAKNLSAWVNEALRLKLESDQRLSALATFIAAFEVEHGEITADEMRDADRSTKARARRPAMFPPAPPRSAGSHRR